jgi:Flp pilus assembly protein TadG
MAPGLTADNGGAMTIAFRNAKNRHQRGTALIEFTLVLPLLLVLTVAAVDFGRAFFVKGVVEQAAREGVRMRAVTTAADTALVRDRVVQIMNSSGVGISSLLIEGPLATKQVHVEVTGQFNWLFPGMFNLFGANFTNPMPLSGDAWMRTEGS